MMICPEAMGSDRIHRPTVVTITIRVNTPKMPSFFAMYLIGIGFMSKIHCMPTKFGAPSAICLSVSRVTPTAALPGIWKEVCPALSVSL